MNGQQQEPTPKGEGSESYNTFLPGEHCNYCGAERMFSFVSPAFGPSHFCQACGVVALGDGFLPSATTRKGACRAAHGNAPGHFGNPGRCPLCAPDSLAGASVPAVDRSRSYPKKEASR